MAKPESEGEKKEARRPSLPLRANKNEEGGPSPPSLLSGDILFRPFFFSFFFWKAKEVRTEEE